MDGNSEAVAGRWAAVWPKNWGSPIMTRKFLEEIAKRTDLSEKYIHGMVEKRPSFSFPIHVGRSFRCCMQNGQWELNLAVFREQSAIITDMANASDCVIVGAVCGLYFGADARSARLFVHADMDSRLRRCRRKAAGDENLEVETS